MHTLYNEKKNLMPMQKRRNIVDLLTNFKKLTMVNSHSLDYCF